MLILEKFTFTNILKEPETIEMQNNEGNWSGGPYGLIKFGFRVRKNPQKQGQEPHLARFFL